MSYRNTTPVLNNQLNYLHNNDESVIHINKYRFPEFYYEELDKLNKKYYLQPSTSIGNESLTGITQSIEEEPECFSETQPISIPSQVATNWNPPPCSQVATNWNPPPCSQVATNWNPPLITNQIPITNCSQQQRYRLDSLNNFMNSPQHHVPTSPTSISCSELDMSISPPFKTLISSGQHNTGINTNIPGQQSTQVSSSNTGVITGPNVYSEFNIPSASQQMIIKRVYDNYITFNIDSFLANITPGNNLPGQPTQTISHTKYALETAQDFICDQLGFICDLLQHTPVEITRTVSGPSSSDPFNLFNMSTIGLLFDRMNKSQFSFRLAHIEIMTIINELTARNIRTYAGTLSKPVVKQSFLDAAIGILQYTTIDLLQPGLAVAQTLVKSLTELIDWIYSNYGRDYWMPPQLLNVSYNLACDLSSRFGVNMVNEIYKTIRLYFTPNNLFSVSRVAWKFTNIHRRQINKLRGVIIQPSSTTQWIIKCLDQTRNIPWIHPDTPHIRNIIIFVDGRNWFYSSDSQTTGTTIGEINLDLFRKFIQNPEYKKVFTDLVYNRITELMITGRQLTTRDPRFIIPIFIFNEKHRHQIQSLVPNNHNIIYTPRGRNDDLMTLYLWLSNPGSFIASNDNFGEHAARIHQHSQQPKYFEGLWIQLIQCFKLINPFTTNLKHKNNNIFSNQPGTSAPF